MEILSGSLNTARGQAALKSNRLQHDALLGLVRSLELRSTGMTLFPCHPLTSSNTPWDHLLVLNIALIQCVY